MEVRSQEGDEVGRSWQELLDGLQESFGPVLSAAPGRLVVHYVNEQEEVWPYLEEMDMRLVFDVTPEAWHAIYAASGAFDASLYLLDELGIPEGRGPEAGVVDGELRWLRTPPRVELPPDSASWWAPRAVPDGRTE